MKITVQREIEVTHLVASMGVRYWEDATVNGVKDTAGELIPLRVGDRWDLVINLETGKITGWPQGTTASVHYKVCDNGSYQLHPGGDVHAQCYVPYCLSPKENGHGDYVIMDIDENGVIQDWEPDLGDLT